MPDNTVTDKNTLYNIGKYGVFIQNHIYTITYMPPAAISSLEIRIEG